MIVFGAGSDEPVVNRHGIEFSPEESKRFYLEEVGGACPECGNLRELRVVTWRFPRPVS